MLPSSGLFMVASFPLEHGGTLQQPISCIDSGEVYRRVLIALATLGDVTQSICAEQICHPS